MTYQAAKIMVAVAVNLKHVMMHQMQLVLLSAGPSSISPQIVMTIHPHRQTQRILGLRVLHTARFPEPVQTTGKLILPWGSRAVVFHDQNLKEN